jgi:hypothetical protein
MNWLPADTQGRATRIAACAAMALVVAGCANLNPLSAGGVDTNSTVAAEVAAASRAPGRYPRFSDIPAVPSDVRRVPLWRSAVLAEWATKRRVEHEAAALPFTLANTEAWAAGQRSKIPLPETIPPTPNAGEATEAFAASARARATPPPPPQ